MAALLSDEWLAEVVDAAGALPPLDDVDMTLGFEVAGGQPDGKRRLHAVVAGGRLTSFVDGKAPDPIAPSPAATTTLPRWWPATSSSRSPTCRAG